MQDGTERNDSNTRIPHILRHHINDITRQRPRLRPQNEMERILRKEI
jgi:hypothetical protein